MRLDESRWNPNLQPRAGYIFGAIALTILAPLLYMLSESIGLGESIGYFLVLASVLLMPLLWVIRDLYHRLAIVPPKVRRYCAWVDNGLPGRALELRDVAGSLDLQFDAGRNAQIPERLKPKLDLILGRKFSCSKQYMRVRNIICGDYQRARFTYFDIFDISREEPDYYKNLTPVIAIELPRAFPRLRIGRQNYPGNAKGWSDDIDLDSYEFSELFDIRSRDKKFAYDFCNPEMMEFLIANASLTIRIHDNLMLLPFTEWQTYRDPSRTINASWNNLIEIRSRMPNFLFES